MNETGDHSLIPIEGMEDVRIKFAGVVTINGAPKIDDRMTFLVETVCTGFGVQRGNSGELVPTATMRVVDLEVKSGPTRPNGTPDLFTFPDE